MDQAGTILHTEYVLTHRIMITAYEVGSMSILILQMRKLRQKELRKLPKVLELVINTYGRKEGRREERRKLVLDQPSDK